MLVVIVGVLLDPLHVRRLLDPSHPSRSHLLDVLRRSGRGVLAGANLQNKTIQAGQVWHHSHHRNKPASFERESLSQRLRLLMYWVCSIHATMHEIKT